MTGSDDSVDADVELDNGDDDAAPDSDSAERVADSPGDPVVRARRSTLLLSAAVVVANVVLDQISKRWALHALTLGEPRHLVWTLQWNLTFNSGMAFSQAQGVGPYIGAIALVVVVVMLVSLRRSNSRGSAVAVGMVVGGAIGNLADRLFRGDAWLRGHVVDFIDLQWWPIFNVADMGVTVGGVLIVLFALLEGRAAQRAHRNASPTAAAKATTAGTNS